MRLDLEPHPLTPTAAVRRVMVNIRRDDDNLRMRFRIRGDPECLALPRISEPRRADGLWERTCFECFIRANRQAAYYEFNLSPSTEWAVYRFDAYRSGRVDADMPAPAVNVSRRPDRFELSAHIAAPSIGATDWRVGLAAVVEERDGGKSYWALAHPAGDPDFHHPDCFVLELPAAKPP
jgi:hypothetical protein